MGLPNKKEKFVFHKGSYKSQCAYMLMLIRTKDVKAWAKFKQEFSQVEDEESYLFFEKLVAFYKGETWEDPREKVKDLKPTKPIVKEKKPAKKSEKKAEKKVKKEEVEAAKKKKVTKKKTKKKVTKKKAPSKKKVTKKKVTKKKVAKKKTKKKVTKKKAASKKKVTKK